MKTSVDRLLKIWTAGTAMCCIVSFLHCTSSITDGNSSETTNVAILTSEGRPAVAAKVKLIDAENWAYRMASTKTVVLDSAVTGDGGTVSFAAFPEAACNLQIDHERSGIVIPDFCRNGKVAAAEGVIRLKKYAKLQGTCVADSGSSAFVTLDGTSYQSSIATDGSFNFPGVAPATYSLVISDSAGKLSLGGTAPLTDGATYTEDIVNPEYTGLLIDDFESGDSTNVLGRIIDGHWYSFNDNREGAHSKTATSIVKVNVPRGTSAMRADIVLGQDTGIALYAGIGVYIGTSRPDWDFSAMTAISFWARGKNTVRVSVESRLVDSIQSWPDFGKEITLDSTWRHFNIPVDSLDLRDSKAAELGITWAMAAKRICRIEFDATEAYDRSGDTIELQIDDLRIEGVSVSDLFMQTENSP